MKATWMKDTTACRSEGIRQLQSFWILKVPYVDQAATIAPRAYIASKSVRARDFKTEGLFSVQIELLTQQQL